MRASSLLSLIFVCAVVSACDHPPPPAAPVTSPAPVASSTAPSPVVSASHVPDKLPVEIDPRDALPMPAASDGEAAFLDADPTMAKVTLDAVGAVPSPVASKLRAQIGEDRVLAELGGMLRLCDGGDDASCKDKLPVDPGRRRTIERTSTLASAVGSLRTASLLAVMGARGLPVAGQMTTLLRARRAMQKPAAACSLPSAAEVTAEEKELDDFVVFERAGGALRGRVPSAEERSDLAYFFVSVANDRAKDPWERKPGELSTTGLAADRDAQLAALARGDLKAARDVGRARLATWGIVAGDKLDPPRAYPADVLPFVWDAAVLFELFGDVNEARWAYRVASGTWSKRASRGGVFSGVLPSMGLARTDGLAGHCRDVAWRHLQRGFTPVDPTEGPAAVAAFGFDVARLYRGGLLTEHREVLSEDKKLAFLPEELRKKTMARVERWGHESYDDRGRLLQGQTELLGRAAIPALLGRAAGNAPGNAERALGILGSLLRQPDAGDPCKPSFEPARPGPIERSVPSLNETCATKLTPAELAPIIAAIGKLSSHRDHDVRYAAVQALGEIETDPASPALRGFLKDTFIERRAPPGEQRVIAAKAAAAIEAVEARALRSRL